MIAMKENTLELKSIGCFFVVVGLMCSCRVGTTRSVPCPGFQGLAPLALLLAVLPALLS
jgi:predicted benzoate:H+ symporter BenE